MNVDRILGQIIENDDDLMGDGQSDIDPDFVKGETNFPHGNGYPNAHRDRLKFEDVASGFHEICADLEGTYLPADDPASYPAFVTLYDITRHPGGHEEGGWWYNNYDPIDSVEVNSQEEAMQVAQQFFSLINKADMDGKPDIQFEKVKGLQAQRPPPSYESVIQQKAQVLVNQLLD